MLDLILGVVAALGLIGCGVAYGYRVSLQGEKSTSAHLRAQVAHLMGAPSPKEGQGRALTVAGR